MNPDLSTALAAGIIVLLCAVLVMIDLLIEHRHAIDHERDNAAHRDLIREIRRHDEGPT